MLQEFKKFIMRGNVVDLAVGVIIGVAFGAIVTSLVSDIIMASLALQGAWVVLTQSRAELRISTLPVVP